jgi:beta-glucanase (GH16 family)
MVQIDENLAANVSTNGTLKSAAFAPSGYSLIWEDGFDGTTINTNNWVVGTLRDPVSGDLIPGAIGDHLLGTGYDGYITAEDSYVENGSLVLRNQKRTYQGTSPSGTYNYTTGWIHSMHRVFLNKGYIEVRAKFPSGDKVWPAIWLISEDLVWGPEWDLWEYFGYRSDIGFDNMGLHLATGTYPSIKWYSKWLSNFDVTTDCETWHVYGFEWTDTYAKWFIDGALVHTLYANTVTNWPNENMYIVLNNETRTDSPDAATTWPNTLEIDYIQVYEKQAEVNLLANSDFESGQPTPWVTYGTTSIVKTNQNSGTYCAKISANNSGFEYTVSGLKPSTAYTFEGYVKVTKTGKANISVKDHGNTEQIITSNSKSYALQTISFVTGAASTSAKLCFYKLADKNGEAYGDDFKLIEQ